MGKYLQFLRTPKGRILILVLLVFAVGWAFLKGCSKKSHFLNRPYTIAVDNDWYPLALYGKGKNMIAFMEDLLSEIGSETGDRFVLLEVGTSSLVPGLNNQRYDAIISSMSPSPLRLLDYYFSEPVYLTGPVVLTRSDSPYKSFSELSGRLIGIPRGMPLTFDVPFPSSASIVPYDNMTIALADLEDNKIDALIMNDLQAYVQIQGIYTGKIKVASPPLTLEGLRLVSLKSPLYEELIESFNKALQTLKENGKFEELTNRWGLFNPFFYHTKQAEERE